MKTRMHARVMTSVYGILAGMCGFCELPLPFCWRIVDGMGLYVNVSVNVNVNVNVNAYVNASVHVY